MPFLRTLFILTICSMTCQAYGQVISGKLDRTRPFEQSSDPTSTLKEDSYSIPADAIEEEVGTPERRARLNTINGHLSLSVSNNTGTAAVLRAENLATVNRERFLEGDRETSRQIVEILKENKAIFGPHAYDNLDLRTLHVLPSADSTKIIFSQYLNDVQVSPSEITVLKDGRVSRIHLQLANPEHPHFSRDAWIPKDSLINLAYEASGLATSRDNIDMKTVQYEIILDPATETFRPALIVVVGHLHVAVDAMTGEEIYAANLTSAVSRRCVRTGNGNPTVNKYCNDEIGGVEQYSIYYQSGSCLGTQAAQAACSNSAFTELFIGVRNVSDYLRDSPYGETVPDSYDFRVKAFAAPGTDSQGGFFHTYPTLLTKPVLSFLPAMDSSSVASPARRWDVGGHEAAHMWQHRNNAAYYTIAGSGYLGRGILESVADTVRAFQSNNNIQLTSNAGSDRVLNPSPAMAWSGTLFTSNAFHDDSIVFSNFFIDVKGQIGEVKAAKFLFYFAKNINGNQAPGPQFTIDDIRATLYACVNSSSACDFLNATDSTKICTVWSSRSFPGSLCATPSVPSAPAWTVITKNGCGWTLKNGIWYYGSAFYITWANVSGEDYFEYGTSTAPFGPFQVQDTFPQNVTTSLPLEYVVSGPGTLYGAIRACNSAGCGPYGGTAVTDTCN